MARKEINPEINVNISAYLPSGYIRHTDVAESHRSCRASRKSLIWKVMTVEVVDRFEPLRRRYQSDEGHVHQTFSKQLR
jgi:hypothetical protein